MKYPKILSLLFLTVFIASCSNNRLNNKAENNSGNISNQGTTNGKFDTKSLPIIQFDKTEHDFGIIVQGEKVTHTFTFKNIGNQELIIKDASASCGCTVPKYSTTPIPPGGQGEIEVIFDSNNRSGRQVKTVTVWTNCNPDQTKLQIFSEIVTLNK